MDIVYRCSGPKGVNMPVTTSWGYCKIHATHRDIWRSRSLTRNWRWSQSIGSETNELCGVSNLPWPRPARLPRWEGLMASFWRQWPAVSTCLHWSDENKMKLDYILGWKSEDFSERLLQNQVLKLGLAKSIHHTHVLIYKLPGSARRWWTSLPSLSRLQKRIDFSLWWWLPRPCGEEGRQERARAAHEQMIRGKRSLFLDWRIV